MPMERETWLRFQWYSLLFASRCLCCSRIFFSPFIFLHFNGFLFLLFCFIGNPNRFSLASLRVLQFQFVVNVVESRLVRSRASADDGIAVICNSCNGIRDYLILISRFSLSLPLAIFFLSLSALANDRMDSGNLQVQSSRWRKPLMRGVVCARSRGREGEGARVDFQRDKLITRLWPRFCSLSNLMSLISLSFVLG